MCQLSLNHSPRPSGLWPHRLPSVASAHVPSLHLHALVGRGTFLCLKFHTTSAFAGRTEADAQHSAQSTMACPLSPHVVIRALRPKELALLCLLHREFSELPCTGDWWSWAGLLAAGVLAQLKRWVASAWYPSIACGSPTTSHPGSWAPECRPSPEARCCLA